MRQTKDTQERVALTSNRLKNRSMDWSYAQISMEPESKKQVSRGKEEHAGKQKKEALSAEWTTYCGDCDLTRLKSSQSISEESHHTQDNQSTHTSHTKHHRTSHATQHKGSKEHNTRGEDFAQHKGNGSQSKRRQ